MNVDGIVFSKRKQAGVGVVIRDEVGQVIAALCQKLFAPLGPLETEAKAMEVGVKFATDVGVWDVLFESDSLVLNNAIHGLNEAAPSVQNGQRNTPKFSRISHFCFFTHKKTRKCFCPHCGPTCSERGGLSSWLEECPGCIMHACMQDVRAFSNYE